MLPPPLAPFVIRFGPDPRSDLLRKNGGCRRCGNRGALIQLPLHHTLDEPCVPFPVGEALAHNLKIILRYGWRSQNAPGNADELVGECDDVTVSELIETLRQPPIAQYCRSFTATDFERECRSVGRYRASKPKHDYGGHHQSKGEKRHA